MVAIKRTCPAYLMCAIHPSQPNVWVRLPQYPSRSLILWCKALAVATPRRIELHHDHRLAEGKGAAVA